MYATKEHFHVRNDTHQHTSHEMTHINTHHYDTKTGGKGKRTPRGANILQKIHICPIRIRYFTKDSYMSHTDTSTYE